MGRSFWNMHIRLQDVTAAEVMEQLAAALQHFFTLHGYVLNQTPYDLSMGDIQLAFHTDARYPWVSLYHDSCDDHMLTQDLPRFLTARFPYRVITFHVEDSDAILICQYRDGHIWACASDDPSRFECADTPCMSESSTVWEGILHDTTTSVDVQQVWMKAYTFAEDKLAALAQLSHLPRQASIGDYEDLWLERGHVQMRTLTVRPARPPARPRPGQGITQFVPQGGVARLTLQKGQSLALPMWMCSFYNIGVAARGITIEIDGTAIADQLLRLTRVAIVRCAEEGVHRPSGHESWIYLPSLDGAERSIYRVSDPSFLIPPGIQDPCSWHMIPDRDGTIMDTLRQAQLALAIEGEAEIYGEGVLRVRLYHDQDKETVSEAFSIPVDVIR